MSNTPTPLLILSLVLLSLCTPAGAADRTAGVASVDITPAYSIRLSGFAARTGESEDVGQRLFAKALALGDGTNVAALLITVDNLGVPDYMTQDVARRLQAKAKLDPARFTVTSTHTHAGPMLDGVLATLFGKDLPADQQGTIGRYTRELADKLEQVALAALADMKPATLEHGTGSVTFAMNRRTKGGPVDHDLPVLVVRNPDGSLRAVYTSYACHCVVLSDNQISGDWAGYAQEIIERNHPGVVALTSIGCGADSNPAKRGSKEAAEKQGKQIADEVERLLKQPLAPVTGALATKLNRIELPFDKHPAREQWEAIAKQQDYAGYHARLQLARLDGGEKLQASLSYPVQTWTFGDQLAVVFLPGEVVVDYALRLKRDFDRSRLWINGYANDVPCYIPSERILKEGGYEAAGAMIFYDRPTRLAPGVEELIVDEVKRQVPETFAAPKGTEGSAPRSAADALRTFQTKPGLEVELVAAEPLVTSPVAIDWGSDGRLWVCEMFDYPTGADNNWQPGGRVKVLTDTDGDGRYDRGTVFLDKLPFPTGVTAWGKDGALVCAAPDILHARDTDGDGKADKVERLFTGFNTENYQARVNSLELGLDNWIYGANGLLGGVIADAAGKAKLDIRSHDFRFRPLVGPMEKATGLTQQGRVRDDWGRWFGCDNSNPLHYYPHELRYLARNPHVPTPPAAVHPPGDYPVNVLHPISRTQERFNNPESLNRMTSACGLGIYRDTLLGDAYAGNAFVCEPVHNLVHRTVLSGDKGGMTRGRAEDEKQSEFLASTDNWFRPVQARTGPDGALYVVDMYRFLIEHPRWIPAERLAKIDVRAGSDRGRIYRLKPAGKPVRPVKDLTTMAGGELAASLDSPSGTERDRVHVELLRRRDAAAVAPLKALANAAPLPQVRVQALSALEGVGGLTADDLAAALADAEPRVREQAVRLCEPVVRGPRDSADVARLGRLLAKLVDDPSPLVRYQLALTLGEWNAPEASAALAKLARAGLNDADVRTAVLSSAAGPHCGDVLAAVMEAGDASPGQADWIAPLVATAAASDDPALLARALAAVLPAGSADPGAGHFTAMATLLDGLERKHVALPALLKSRPELSGAEPRVARSLAAARAAAASDAAPAALREAALRVLGRGGNASEEELDLLCKLVVGGGTDEPVRTAALAALRRQDAPAVADCLLAGWRRASPAARAGMINLLMTRQAWTVALLNAVRARTVRSHELSLLDRQRLAESESADVRKLAAELFPAEPRGERAEVVKRYVAVATSMAGTADAGAGAEIFAQNCAACHELNGVGHAVGPDLAAERGKDAGYFVQNILDPSAIVEPRFANYQVMLNDRRVLAGLITAESAGSLTLATGGGATEAVARGDVKGIRVSPLSMTPDGFENAITPEQMAHLIAFLQSSGGRKTFAGNTPAMVAPAKDNSLMLPASKAAIFGGNIAFETPFQNVGFWDAAGDHVAWTARVAKAGTYDVYLDYACAADAAGNRYVVEARAVADARGRAGRGPGAGADTRDGPSAGHAAVRAGAGAGDGDAGGRGGASGGDGGSAGAPAGAKIEGSVAPTGAGIPGDAGARAAPDAGEKIEGTVAATGPEWDRYVQVKAGTIRLAAGEHRVTLRPAGAVRGALMDLRTLALVPAGVTPKWPKPKSPGDGVPRDAGSVAQFILDAARSTEAREAAINANPQFAAELITQLTTALPPAAEYDRIPWIWRVAIACGRRDEPGELKALIAASLPDGDAPLRDWQAVVIGGGVINGLSQRGHWPGVRVAEVLAGDRALESRWQRALGLAATMADDERVRPGTRYDALRMLGVRPWQPSGDHLARYLADPNAELQMGAVSGLADVSSPQATAALLGALPSLRAANRQLALDALLRDDARAVSLLHAIADGKLPASTLGEATATQLLASPSAAVRELAAKTLRR